MKTEGAEILAKNFAILPKALINFQLQVGYNYYFND